MRITGLIILGAFVSLCAAARSAEPDAPALVKQAIQAVGGQDKLLKLFRTRETVNVSTDAKKQVPERKSIYEPPLYWWTGKNERVIDEKQPKEPATFLVWAWTLGVLIEPKSKIERIPDIKEADRPAFGLRISETIKPPMDIYFDQEKSLLVRIDWRSDIHRFSDWKEHDGVKYPAHCVGYKKATGQPWYYSQIVELERLKELPEGYKRR
jgi:hypothetical protein